jgi:hypothetical protein
MARQVRLPTYEMGDLVLLLIRSTKGQWETEWEPLRGTVFGDLFTVVSKEVIDHALHRLSGPLVKALGLPPAGALRKIPLEFRKCQRRDKCPMFDPKRCFPEAKKMPYGCFESDGVEDPIARLQATQAIDLWRNGVYIVVVEE